ncbi:MAG: ABC transporter substrate-binding protein [Blastocatellia bacterium]
MQGKNRYIFTVANITTACALRVATAAHYRGKNTFINDLIRLAGGQSIFQRGKAADTAIFTRNRAARAPEIIIVPASHGTELSSVLRRIKHDFAVTPAVKNKRVV